LSLILLQLLVPIHYLVLVALQLRFEALLKFLGLLDLFLRAVYFGLDRLDVLRDGFR